jgi:chromosomal replication initiator protein
VFKQDLRRHLEKVYPNQELSRWFDPLSMKVDENSRTLQISFPHAYFKDWFMLTIQKDFERQVERLAENFTFVYESGRTREGQGPGHVFRAANERRKRFCSDNSAANDPFPKDDAASSFTFDSFIVNRKNDFPLAAAKESAVLARAGEKVPYTPFVLYGHSGAGKTHILWSLANAVRAHGLSVYCGDSLYLENFCLAPGRYAVVAEDCVCIDDVQRLADSSAMQEALAALIDKFQERGKLLALAMDQHPSTCSAFSQKLRTRLTSGLVVEIKRPDLDVRCQYVQGRNLRQDLGLSKEQMLSLCQRHQDIRCINGALTRLSLFRAMPDLAGAADTERLLNQSEERLPLTPAAVTTMVSRHFSLNPEDIIGKSKEQRIAHARHIAIYLCRELVGLSLVQTGNFFGGRDHSSILYSIKKIKKLQTSDKNMHNVVKELRKQCLALV